MIFFSKNYLNTCLNIIVSNYMSFTVEIHKL